MKKKYKKRYAIKINFCNTNIYQIQIILYHKYPKKKEMLLQINYHNVNI